MSTFPISTGEPRTRDTVRHEVRRRSLTVQSRTRLTDSLVRFTLVGDDLAGFTSFGPEDHVKVVFDSADGPVGRDYTPSEFRPLGRSSGPELDLDFVVHGTAGSATAWATAAQPGATLQVGGPRGSRLAPAGFRNVILLADASGMPALRRWVRAYAGVTPVHAVLFGDDATLLDHLDEAEALAATPQVALTGRFDLLEVVRAQDITADTFVWAAGEAGDLIPVRRWLKGEAGLPAGNLSLHGYWKRGTAGLDHHAPLDPADPD
ncbi:siderophore-interacting protein [uncultured Amnibacterium sp.]|uniref:siderophore-interacting protein n=1 Tax=uncultured Amnibacterium sp. TaxID=1631851 RepID=UPI0035C9CA46